MSYEELASQLEDLQQVSDENAETVSAISESVDNQEGRIGSLEESSGQLMFPLSQESIDLIKQIFVTGFIVLVAGTANIVDPRISTDSIIVYSRATPAGGLGNLAITSQISGSATITSDDATETSIIYYFFIAP